MGDSDNSFFLERVSVRRIREQKKRTQDLINYHALEYALLATQRERIKDVINEALKKKCICNYEFSKWQRAVKYKYSLHPLSCVGSIKFIGQRFNYGEEINGNLSPFPALYLAKDKATALQESLALYSIKSTDNLSDELNALDLAMMSSQSQTIVSISGKLDTVLDLRTSRALVPFVNIIKNFKLDRRIKARAKELNVSASKLIRKPKELWDTIMSPNWRQKIILYDSPANSQIIGDIALKAGICGILYKSKFNGKECLAVFPDSFESNDSFVCLDDTPPHRETPKRLDGSNNILARMTYEKLLTLRK